MEKNEREQRQIPAAGHQSHGWNQPSL